MHLFVSGRKHTVSTLKKHISEKEKTLWFHCASLGEFEQGLPIMEAIKHEQPSYKIVVSFFSPSGYEIKKNTPIADVVVYLPLDTKANARKFIELTHPTMALFVKYEFWPNYLFELERKNIPTILVSGLFRENQVFFKPYGNFMRKALTTINHHFVQNKLSANLLNTIKITNVTVSGDTRFDRVSHQIEQDNRLDFMEIFKGDSLCIVCGSTWPEDETVLLPFINTTRKNTKFVIAPHTINPTKIANIQQQLTTKSVCFSKLNGDTKTLEEAQVLIIDTIGLLTKIYSYAAIAYIGGAMGKTGLHNILEAATFGVPIIIGQHYEEFPEAKRLQSLAGLFSIKNNTELQQIMNKLITDSSFRNKTGMIAGHFINSNTGATAVTMKLLRQHLINNS